MGVDIVERAGEFWHHTAQACVNPPREIVMATTKMPVATMPVATDSAAELHELIGEDATATFESDPKFIDADAAGGASSENVEVQRETGDVETRTKS